MSEVSGISEPQRKDLIAGRKSIEIEGRKISYIERGNPQGEPFIYIGGWMSSASGDRLFMDALSGKIPNSVGFQNLVSSKPQSAEKLGGGVNSLKDKYRVLDVELPGFGKSQALKGKINLDRMADFVAKFQKAVDAENSIVLGSSMGGIVAIKLASRHPEAVKLLVLQGVMTRPSDMDKTAYIAAQVATSQPIRYIFSIPGVLSWVFEKMARGSKDFRMSNEEFQNAMIEGIRLGDAKTGIKTLRGIGRDIIRDVSKVKCPVILVDGVHGDLVPFVNTKRIAKTFHRNMPLEEKERMTRGDEGVTLAISGAFGKQGHTVVNTAPEVLAVLVDKMSERLLKEQSSSL